MHSAGSAVANGLIAPLFYHHGAMLALGMMALVTLGWACWTAYLRIEARDPGNR